MDSYRYLVTDSYRITMAKINFSKKTIILYSTRNLYQQETIEVFYMERFSSELGKWTMRKRDRNRIRLDMRMEGISWMGKIMDESCLKIKES